MIKKIVYKIISYMVFLTASMVPVTINANNIQIIHVAKSGSSSFSHQVFCYVDGTIQYGPSLFVGESSTFFLPQGENYSCQVVFRITGDINSSKRVLSCGIINLPNLANNYQFTGTEVGSRQLTIETTALPSQSCTVRVVD